LIKGNALDTLHRGAYLVYEREKKERRLKIMYFITISEMFGTKGDEIAQKVAKGLNYTYYGEAELLKFAGEIGFLTDVKKLDEKGPPLFERFFSEKPKVSLDRLQSVIFEVAKKGDALFFGKGSQLLLNSFNCALHVLVTGSPEKRIQRIMEEKKVDRDIAEKMIHRSDQDKRGFLRFAFEEDWLNPNLYDLVLNTDKLAIDSAVKMVMEAAKSDGIKACGIDSMYLLEKLSLQRKVEAAFLEAGLASQHTFYNVEDGETVRLYGLVYSLDEKETLEKMMKGTKGVKKVINNLTVFKGSMGGA
jgi:cytidylate kinase